MSRINTKSQLRIATFLVVVGCGLLIAGFIVSPTGQIHETVLVAFGEVMTFAGAILGIDYHYRVGAMIREGIKEEEGDDNK